MFAQYIGMLGDVEDRVVTCFRGGGGVAYELYPRFNEVMSEDSGQTVLGALDQHILPLVPDLEQRLAARYPNSQFVAYDLSAAALQQAHEQAWESGLQNIIFEPRDLHVCLDVTGASFQYGAESAQRVLWPVEGVCSRGAVSRQTRYTSTVRKPLCDGLQNEVPRHPSGLPSVPRRGGAE